MLSSLSHSVSCHATSRVIKLDQKIRMLDPIFHQKEEQRSVERADWLPWWLRVGVNTECVSGITNTRASESGMMMIVFRVQE